jgi:ribonuclease Z
MANLEVTFLGTSAAMPSENRFLSSTVIERNGSLFIFDVGEGMQYNFIRAKRFGFNKKTMIFITHMHSDHILGLLGFFQTLSLQGRTLPVDIYGPELLHDFLAQSLRILHINLSFKLNIHIINSNKGTLVSDKEYQVLYCRSDHGPNLHSFAFCLQENNRPGRFNLEKAKELGIPEGNLYNRLQKGSDIHFNGKLIRSGEVVGNVRPGRKIGISGDTRPTAELTEFFRKCDLLIFESTFKLTESCKAEESYHSTASGAARLAKSAGVNRLCLTHFSTRYKDLDMLLNEAKLVFEDVELAFDLKSITVQYRDS